MRGFVLALIAVGCASAADPPGAAERPEPISCENAEDWLDLVDECLERWPVCVDRCGNVWQVSPLVESD